MANQYMGYDEKRWQSLQIYNSYRVCGIAVLCLLYTLGWGWSQESALLHGGVYLSTLMAYFTVACVFIYITYRQELDFKKTLLLSAMVDVFILTGLVLLSGHFESGVGVMIIVAIAAVSILLPGREGVFFAALASCILLLVSLYRYSLSLNDSNIFYYAGIHGVGFFATSLTALVLANWVQAQEKIAKKQSLQVDELQQLNEYIIKRLHSGIIFVDKHWHIRLINDSASQCFHSKRELTGKHVSELSEALAVELSRWNSDPVLRYQPHRVLLTSPEVIAHILPAESVGGNACLIMLDDMSRMVQHAQQLKLASLGRFTASIAHELRNPLGAIDHAAQLLSESHRLCNEDERLAEIIKNNCERMNDVIKNILQLSRRKKSQPEDVLMIDYLRQFKEEFLHTTQQVLSINVTVDPEHLSVFIDKSQLYQILVILAENSLRHGKEHCGRVHIDVCLGHDRQKQVYLQFKDNGQGVDDDIKNQIFEPFYTTSRSGVGMGLFIAKELCEVNQAYLSLSPAPSGACFKIIFNQRDSLLL